SGRFDEVFIMPAAEDGGTALGAAYHGLWSLTGPRPGPGLETDFLGRDHGVGTPTPETISEVAQRLANGEVIGWFQGRSEFGPRALGHRSILFDPRRPDGQAHLNARVKRREAFRPFAPVVLAEHADAWFDLGPAGGASPFMLRVVPVRPDRREQIPAVTHVDGTARLQTLGRDTEPALRALLEAFHALTGVPLLLNTSLNVMGQPLVETPDDALACLAATGIDCLVLGDRLVRGE
ncbi:MAG: carbamoyltransferase C-terminal domain-containing protein, partial [Myxococcota bacterium]|nr:carbamoyltransferase C-terminal domain-containing protein [Myxococcota bacterium]